MFINTLPTIGELFIYKFLLYPSNANQRCMKYSYLTFDTMCTERCMLKMYLKLWLSLVLMGGRHNSIFDNALNNSLCVLMTTLHFSFQLQHHHLHVNQHVNQCFVYSTVEIPQNINMMQTVVLDVNVHLLVNIVNKASDYSGLMF